MGDKPNQFDDGAPTVPSGATRTIGGAALPGRMGTRRQISDPIERIIAEALDGAGISFVANEKGLDFYLPDHGIHIEGKQFYSERAVRQMAAVESAILIQGRRAAVAFRAMIARSEG